MNLVRIILFSFLFLNLSSAKEQAPKGRMNHGAVYDSDKKQMLMFGGDLSHSNYLGDLWAYDFKKQEWKEIEVKGEEKPQGRAQASMIYVSDKKQVILFGGEQPGKGPSNDLWIYDTEKNEWKEITMPEEDGPPPMYGHSAVYDPAKKQIIIYGGCSSPAGFTSDIWIYDIEKNTWKLIETKEGEEAPPIRHQHCAVYDPDSKRMFIYGGGVKQAFSQPFLST